MQSSSFRDLFRVGSALPTLAADKVTSPRPDGTGDPDATTCRPSQPMPASRLMGPEVCKTNSQWALLRKDGEDISADGTKVDSQSQRAPTRATTLQRFWWRCFEWRRCNVMPLDRKPGCFLGSIVLVFGITHAKAQDAATPPAPAVESVTITGIKNIEAAVSKFVRALTVPTRAAGKLARWKDGVCPLVLGVPPDVGKALVQNIRHVAAEVGAPVNASDACTNNIPGANNIEVIFTAQSQALLDNIRIMHPNLLGYFDDDRHRRKSWRPCACRSSLGTSRLR